MDIVLELQDGDIDALKDYIPDDNKDLDSNIDTIELVVGDEDVRAYVFPQGHHRP